MQPGIGGAVSFSDVVKTGSVVVIKEVSDVRTVVRQVEALGAIAANSLHTYLLGRRSSGGSSASHGVADKGRS